MWRVALICLVSIFAFESCSTVRRAKSAVRTVKDIVRGEDEDAVSFSLEDPEDVARAIDVLSNAGVEALIEEAGTGVTIIKFVGKYSELVGAVTDLLKAGLEALLANDEFSATILAAAFKVL